MQAYCAQTIPTRVYGWYFKRYLNVNALAQFLQRLRTASAVLVTVRSIRGSVPREVGAWMAVFADNTLGTVGGGRLEWDACAHARDMLHAEPGTVVAEQRYALGPRLGQCCGGEVVLGFERVSAQDGAALAQRLRSTPTPVALFGGGHVGWALVQVLARLPMAVTWVDSRDGVFPADVPTGVQCEHSEPVQSAVATLAPGTRVVVMSFSHAEDLDIVAACLQRQRDHHDLPYVGLIGSRTKWASFRTRLQARGFSDAELAQVTCPIGVPGIRDKRPEVIAVVVAAQLLQLPSGG